MKIWIIGGKKKVESRFLFINFFIRLFFFKIYITHLFKSFAFIFVFWVFFAFCVAGCSLLLQHLQTGCTVAKFEDHFFIYFDFFFLQIGMKYGRTVHP